MRSPPGSASSELGSPLPSSCAPRGEPRTRALGLTWLGSTPGPESWGGETGREA